MEKESRLKLRISKMFRSSFASCRPRSSSDVVDSAVLSPQSHPLSSIRPRLHRPASAPAERRPLPSLCPDPARSINPTCIVSAKKAVSLLPRRSWTFPYGSSAVEHYHRYSSLTTVSRRYCPSSSPFYKSSASKQSKSRKKDKKKKTSLEKDKLACRRQFLASTSSQDTNTTYGGCDWFSSDDERDEEVNEDSDGHYGDESDTLFSSSDDSSSRRHIHQRRRSLRKPSGSLRKTSSDVPAENAGGDIDIKGSFAVVKRSSDPYGDFRTSMVEMIIERQLFGDEELRRLLRCFLALNSSRHHGVIVEVFSEIRETLFSSSAGRWS